jgi:hypothetical protein
MKFAFFLSGREHKETGAVISRIISSRWRAVAAAHAGAKRACP